MPRWRISICWNEPKYSLLCDNTMKRDFVCNIYYSADCTTVYVLACTKMVQIHPAIHEDAAPKLPLPPMHISTTFWQNMQYLSTRCRTQTTGNGIYSKKTNPQRKKFYIFPVWTWERKRLGQVAASYSHSWKSYKWVLFGFPRVYKLQHLQYAVNNAPRQRRFFVALCYYDYLPQKHLSLMDLL